MSVYIDDIVKILTQPAYAGATVVGYDSNFSSVKVWRDMDGDVLLLVA